MQEPKSSSEGENLEVLQQISQGFSVSQELKTCAQFDQNKKKKKRKHVQAYCLLNNINKHSKKKENFFLTFRDAFNIGYFDYLIIWLFVKKTSIQWNKNKKFQKRIYLLIRLIFSFILIHKVKKKWNYLIKHQIQCALAWKSFKRKYSCFCSSPSFLRHKLVKGR